MNTFTKRSHTRPRENHGRRGRIMARASRPESLLLLCLLETTPISLTETTAQMWAEQGWHIKTSQSGRGNIHGGLSAIERTREGLEATDGGLLQGRTRELVV